MNAPVPMPKNTRSDQLRGLRQNEGALISACWAEGDRSSEAAERLATDQIAMARNAGTPHDARADAQPNRSASPAALAAAKAAPETIPVENRPMARPVLAPKFLLIKPGASA